MLMACPAYHDSRFIVPIVSENAFWLWKCFGFWESISVAGIRLSSSIDESAIKKAREL